MDFIEGNMNFTSLEEELFVIGIEIKRITRKLDEEKKKGLIYYLIHQFEIHELLDLLKYKIERKIEILNLLKK